MHGLLAFIKYYLCFLYIYIYVCFRYTYRLNETMMCMENMLEKSVVLN